MYLSKMTYKTNYNRTTNREIDQAHSRDYVNVSAFCSLICVQTLLADNYIQIAQREPDTIPRNLALPQAR